MIPAENVIPVRGEYMKTLPLEQLSKINYLAISYGALKAGELKAGDVVVVAGYTFHSTVVNAEVLIYSLQSHWAFGCVLCHSVSGHGCLEDLRYGKEPNNAQVFGRPRCQSCCSRTRRRTEQRRIFEDCEGYNPNHC